MRQPLLDFILMHGTIGKPNCLRSFASIEFLQGMTTVDTRKGRNNDSEYLHRVADTMGSTADGELMGDMVTSLKLNIYAKFAEGNFHSFYESNIHDAARLISKCRNLERLYLRFAGMTANGAPSQQQPVSMSPILKNFLKQRCGLFDANGPFQMCISVLENVKEFSLMVSTFGRWTLWFPLMRIGNSPIHFNRLIVLRLANCIVPITSWCEFLNSARETLTTVHLCYFLVNGASGESCSPLPFPLPHLKEISIPFSNGPVILISKPPIGEVLSKCPELEHVDLRLWCPASAYECEMKSLTKLGAVYNVDIELSVNASDKLERISKSEFSEKIICLNLTCPLLDRQYIATLEHLLDICQNLTEFYIRVDVRDECASIV